VTSQLLRRGLLLLGAVLVLVVIGSAVMVARRGGGTAPVPPPPPSPLLAGAPAVVVPPPAPARRVSGVGYDVSYPQCGRTLPVAAAFAIVGVNGGAPLTTNRCLREHAVWARGTRGRAVYVNTANPGTADPVAYGRRLAKDAVAREHAAGVGATSMWWLDVEVTNRWSGDVRANATVLAAMAATLQQLGARVGIYSTPEQWAQIAGRWSPGLPVWNATGTRSRTAASTSCAESFAGSSTAIVQWQQRVHGKLLDNNSICPLWQDRASDLLEPSQS
jgi:hypothetical protein